MAISVSSIVERAGLLLQDAGATRWTATERLGWLNDGLRELPLDAKVKVTPITLLAGVRQTLPADGRAVLSIDSDAGAVTPCSRSALDAFSPGWTMRGGRGAVHFMVDPADPLAFYIYPAQATAGLSLSLTYSAFPATATTGGTLDVQDKYANNLLDYVLYRAYSKDAEFAGAAERALAHYQAFSK